MKCVKLCYLYYFVVSIQSTRVPGKFCDPLSDDVKRQCFVKETLATLTHSPNQLAVDITSNTLYFSFDSGQGEYVPAILRIDTKKLTVLKGVKDAFAVATDAVTGDVYFGGSHGIYKYNTNQKDLKRLAVNNLDIWWLLIKENIYFIKFPSLHAYYYQNKTIKAVPQLKSISVHQFTMDNEGNMFFINNTGLFGIKKGSLEHILLKSQPKFLAMSIDNKEQVYVCSEDGIFTLNKLFPKVTRFINIQGVLGLTFDKDNNLIYTNSHELIRLIPIDNGQYHKNVYVV